MATLKTLENELEQEVQRFENSAIKVGQLLNRIKESGAFEEAGYRYFQPYYRERWEERIGRSWNTASGYISAAKTLREMSGSGDLTHPVTDVRAAQKLGAIEDPAERVEVWNEHVESGEKRAGYENLDRRIREHKGEPPKPEPTVREVLTNEDMEEIPSGEFDHAEEKASLTSKIVPKRTDDTAEVAEAAYRLYGENIERHIRWADEISSWYGKYRDDLVARRRQGIRAVKDGESG